MVALPAPTHISHQQLPAARQPLGDVRLLHSHFTRPVRVPSACLSVCLSIRLSDCVRAGRDLHSANYTYPILAYCHNKLLYFYRTCRLINSCKFMVTNECTCTRISTMEQILTMLHFSTMVYILTIVEKNTYLAAKSMSYVSELDLIRKVGTDIEGSSQK